MHECEVTWGRALLVWFHLMWRILLYATLGGFVIGLVLTLLLPAYGVSTDTMKQINMILGGLWGLAVNIWVVKHILNLRTRGFRIALIES